MKPPPEVAAAAASAAPGEKPLHCVAADLDACARYREGHLLVTERSVLAITGGRVVQRYTRTRGDRFAAHVMTGSGVFLVTPEGGTGRTLAWFSRRHANAYLRLAAALDGSTRVARPERDAAPADGLGAQQRGGFARDWVAEPLRDPRGAIRRLLAFIRPHRGTMLLTLLLFMAANLLTLLLPQLTRVLIDDWLVPRNVQPGPVALLLAAMAASYVLRTGILVLRNRGVARLSAALVFDLRQAVYASVQAMSLRFIAAKPSGDVLNRVASDTTNLRRFLQSWATDGMSQVLLFVLLCAVAFAQNWLLALLTIATVPLAALLAVAVWRLARWMERTHHRLHDKIGSLVHDVLAGIRVVKAFRREQAEISRYRHWTARKYLIDVRNQKIWRVMGPVVEFATRLGEVLVLLVGGALVLAGELSVGELVQFAAYVVLLVEPLAWAGEMPQRLVEALTSAERVFEAVDQQPEITAPERPVSRELSGAVEFAGVEFAYRPGEPVLRDFSLRIAAGEMLGLVGASGAGKSTVINLLLRLYDVDRGAVTLDGIDLRNLEPAALRRQVSVVLQDPFLFSGTVADNIRYARPDAANAEVLQAARVAQAYDFVMGFPDGFDTVVGERGQHLSGGERQRISIARALLRNPTILILDEATSALDLETEERIHAALAALTTGRTVIAIAHRLATLRRAGRLVVMEAGGIAESGTHAELLAAGGRYRRMVEAQRALADARTLTHA